MNIPVVYEDDWLLIVDKPPGLLTIPTHKNEKRTLTGILNEDLKDRGISYHLHPCHRLDRETSGLIIYAKGKSAQKKMMHEFHKLKVKKRYLAFVLGAPPKAQGEINYPISGARANTAYKILAKKRDFAIVEVNPSTGRTNQIRIHFKQIGHPVLGEDKYAFRRDFPIKAKRLCLHAQSLEFRHPITGKIISLSLGLAPDLKEFLISHA